LIGWQEDERLFFALDVDDAGRVGAAEGHCFTLV
jgi:hypothetical protein